MFSLGSWVLAPGGVRHQEGSGPQERRSSDTLAKIESTAARASRRANRVAEVRCLACGFGPKEPDVQGHTG